MSDENLQDGSEPASMDSASSIVTMHDPYAAGQAVDEAEYEICLRRGHQESGVSMSMGWETWQRCRWCNTEYRFGEPRLIEREI